MTQKFLPGVETWYATDSPTTSFSAVFEDDCQTAYFYAYDRGAEKHPILDAVLIYNVTSVTDRDIESSVDIIWSRDGLQAALLINDYPHAVIDFAAHSTYCRSGFPPGSERWHHAPWDDALMKLFSKPSI